MNNSNEEQITIQVSPVEACSIDYNMSVKELEAFFDEQNSKIKAGEKQYLTGEFMQLGYALDFIAIVQRNLKIYIDFEEERIAVYEDILNSISKLMRKGVIPRDAMGDMIKKATGFFSVMIWKNIGGGFISSNIGYGVNVNGTNVFVYNRIGRRLQGDKNANVVSFYKEIKSLL